MRNRLCERGYLAREPCGCFRALYATQTGKAPSRTRGYWGNLSNQQEFFNGMGRQLNVRELGDWYSITRQQITRGGGRGLFDYYPSLEAALRAVYPHFPWQTSKFEDAERLRKGYKVVLSAMKKAEEMLNIKQPEDWYSVTLADLKQIGFPTAITKSRLAELLSQRYPDFKWDQLLLLKSKYSQQRRLEKAVSLLFPDVELKVNVRREANLVNPNTGEFLELDIYLPSLKLAFEHQEKHHYTSAEYAYKPLEAIQQRDSIKRDLASRSGITLVTVPPWWDTTVESLAATVKQLRPDLLQSFALRGAVPISEEMPSDFLTRENESIEGIGVPTTACFFSLSNVDPVNWWMFEKYDGVRGFWNPTTGSIYSRTGRKLLFPKEVLDTMPKDVFLDGELWFGVDNFQDALKMSSKGDLSKGLDWTKFKYMVFDIPNHQGGTYQERYDQLVKHISSGQWKHVEVAPKQVCKDVQHLETFFQDVIDKGGEGVILRDPQAPLQSGRSPGYLKHKKFRDAEARVVEAVGNNQWECELPNGVRFTAGAGTSEFLKRSNPRPGDIVSFKHRGYMLVSQKPKLPTIYRLRTDIDWDTVLSNWKENKASSTVRPIRKKMDRKPRGFWMDVENRRKFFLEIAESLKFDPSVARNWKKVRTAHVVARKGRRLLGCYKGSVARALKDTFPSLLETKL